MTAKPITTRWLRDPCPQCGAPPFKPCGSRGTTPQYHHRMRCHGCGKVRTDLWLDGVCYSNCSAEHMTLHQAKRGQ